MDAVIKVGGLKRQGSRGGFTETFSLERERDQLTAHTPTLYGPGEKLSEITQRH